MPHLDRDRFIELLERLGAPSDAEVLAAAREIHGRVQAAALDWHDLLAPPPDAERLSDDNDSDISPFEIKDRRDDRSVADQEPIPPRQAQRFAEELALIDSLLARPALALETRRELLDLRADIAANEFADMDGRYLRDLAARLDAKG